MNPRDEGFEVEGSVPEETPHEGDKVGLLYMGEHVPEVGPELGHLQLAHHEDGSPVLVLTPGANARVDWQLEAPWKVVVSSQHPSTVVLKMDQAPASGCIAKLTDIAGLVFAALKRLEDIPRIERHLTDASRRLIRLWTRRTLAVGLAGLAVGGSCVGLAVNPSLPREVTAAALTSQAEAPYLSGDSREKPISYPLPEKPFKDQAIPPCQTDRGELEINGGCWGKFSIKPPCDANMAEHKGECYLPLSKKRGGKPPSSQEP